MSTLPDDRTVDAYSTALAKVFDRTGIAGRWPWLVTNSEQLRAYAYALVDIPIELVTQALDGLSGEDQQPSPQRIRREVAAVCGLLGRPWDEAWSDAVRYARWEQRYLGGEYDLPKPDVDGEITRVLRLVGGPTEALGDSQATVRAHFRDLWTARQTRVEMAVIRPRGEIARRVEAAALTAGAPVRALPGGGR